MLSRLVKLALVAVAAISIAIILGGLGVTSTSAGSPPSAPPTVALPTPKSTKATPVPTTRPAANMQTGTGPRVVPGTQTGWVSAFRVQNLGTAQATCTYTFYDSAGATAYTSSSQTIAVGDSLFVYTPNLSGLASGQYSGVVSCDQQVAAVVNYSAPAAGGAGSGGDVYSGIATPGTTWYAPNIFNNYFNYYTNVVIQNATGSTNTITVSIYAPGGTSPVKTQTCTNVAAYASCSLEQEGAAELSQNISYSAVITGSGNIAPIVNIYGKGSVLGQQFSYNAFAGGATTVYAPVIMNAYSTLGYNTAITVMNIGGSTTNVMVTYGSGQTQTVTGLANRSAQVFYTPQSGIPSGQLTSATITSSASNVIVLVNESNAYNRAASYNGFTAGASTARAPIVMRRYANYNTSVTCQNVGSGATTMSLAYGGISGTNSSGSIAVGSSALFYQPSDSLLTDGFIGSATITASGGGASIVCIVNEDMNESPNTTISMDQLYSYNAFAQ